MTPERAELERKLIQLVNAGLSYSEAGKEYGLSRSAVSGILHRHRLRHNLPVMPHSVSAAKGGRAAMKVRWAERPAVKPAPDNKLLRPVTAAGTPRDHFSRGVSHDDPTARAAAALLEQAKRKEMANRAAREVRTL